MKRGIVGYHQDASGDWVAELDCFHPQHVRHRPPFTNRPWVVTRKGREERIGTTLNCVLCDRLEMPDGVEVYKRTPTFTSRTIPAGMSRRHSTKRGVWGRISVLEGVLEYTVEEPERATIEIAAGGHANIPPEMIHSVKARGAVSFFIEFCTR